MSAGRIRISADVAVFIGDAIAIPSTDIWRLEKWRPCARTRIFIWQLPGGSDRAHSDEPTANEFESFYRLSST